MIVESTHQHEKKKESHFFATRYVVTDAPFKQKYLKKCYQKAKQKSLLELAAHESTAYYGNQQSSLPESF